MAIIKQAGYGITPVKQKTVVAKQVVPKPKPVVVPKPVVPKPALGMAGLGVQSGYVGQAQTAAAPFAPWGPSGGVPRSAAPGNFQANLADIFGNPLYQQARGSFNTSMQDFMDALKGNVGQAVIKSGYDPTEAFNKLISERPDLGEFSGLLSGVDRAAAAANPTSQRAMIEQGYNRGVENQAYELAARGMGQSGAAATGTNALLQDRQMKENETRDALLQAITGGMTGYLGQRTEGKAHLEDVATQVAELYAQQPGGPYEQGDMTPADEVAANPNVVPGTNVPSAQNTNFINWGGQQISNVGQMQQWLKQHGGNWNTWVIQHPDAAKKLLALS